MKKTFVVISSFLLILSSNTHAGLFGPSNYEDCVLEGLKDAKTNAAVGAVYSMCGSKFPDKSSVKSNEIPELCLLYWDGLRTKKLTSVPKDWGGRLSRFRIARYEVEVAHVFVPKSYQETESSQQEMFEQVNLFCR